MMNINKTVKLGIILLILVGSGGCSSDSSGQKVVDEPSELIKVAFGTVHFMGEAPSYVAYYNGYFEEEGLNITLKTYPAGKVSLAALFEGEADIITTADTPIVYACFDRDDFYIIGSMMHSDRIAAAVARKDRGIFSATDLKGKKVGLFQGTASDFFMDSYFIENGLTPSDVEIVNLKPLELVDAIVNGEIDAMFSWQPHILNAQNQLGENSYRLSTEGIKTLDWLIIVKRDYAEENPDVLLKFLKAINRAEEFMAENREEAIDIHYNEIGMDREIVDALWGDSVFELTLSESMLINFEDQARWAIREEKTNTTKVPDYLDWIYFDALEKVRPEGISIIR